MDDPGSLSGCHVSSDQGSVLEYGNTQRIGKYALAGRASYHYCRLEAVPSRFEASATSGEVLA